MNITSKSTKIAAWLIVIPAFIGMVDASFLLLEYLAALAHPGELTPCSPSTLVSCTKTVQGAWAHYFTGVPNPILGMLWYSGCTVYGIALVLGTQFSRSMRTFFWWVLVLGLLFSFRLYIASVIELRGVCPFCLASTTASTLITIGFVVNDAQSDSPALGKSLRKFFTLFQLFAVLTFGVGLPVFIGIFLPLLLDPWQAVLHWSFPVMTLLVIIMWWGNIWGYRTLKKQSIS